MNPNNAIPNLGFKKGSLGPCTEPHGSDTVHTHTACNFCDKRVCQMHQLNHVTGHFQTHHAALKQIVETGDEQSKALAAAAITPKKA